MAKNLGKAQIAACFERSFLYQKGIRKTYAYRVAMKNITVLYSLESDPLTCDADTLYLHW